MLNLWLEIPDKLMGEPAMKCLIVDDDFITRHLLQTCLSKFDWCFAAVNGCEAVDAVKHALDEGEPYDLICLDIMMPEMDGIEALRAIRQLEKEYGKDGADAARVIMTTAKDQPQTITMAFRTGCEAYIVKPIKKGKLLEEIDRLGLLSHTV